MRITSVPITEQEAAEQAELRGLMIKSYRGELPLDVRIVNREDAD